jgi:transmembrane sensor
MQPTQLKLFLEKFPVGTYTEAEHQQFIEWLKTASVAKIETLLDEYKNIIAKNNSSYVEVNLKLVAHIEAAIDQYELGKKRKSAKGKLIPWRNPWRIAAASLIIFIAGTASYFAFRTTEHKTISKALPQQLKNDVSPGANKAILTLSDGSTIILDDAKNGQVAQQGAVEIAKLANGQLVYNVLDGKPVEVVFNTLTTPRGGQFKLTLPDGSEVWLNAASSIKYPTAFVGNERKVEISGEAYFEIVHDAAKPFKVSVNGMEVKVIGTHFNINAYRDEDAVKTTLIEGSISLSSGDAVTARLRPGQQAQIGNSRQIKVIDNVDIDQVVAWKNGYFSFNRADLQTVMRQLARWYDVDVIYEGKIPERLFGGKIHRNTNASEALKVLEEMKVHFRIEEKKIFVRP